jgi:hypothetical protein
MQGFKNNRVLMNSKLGRRGLIPVEAKGCTWLAQVSAEFMELTRALLVLRLLSRNTHHVEEGEIYSLLACVCSTWYHTDVTYRTGSSTIPCVTLYTNPLRANGTRGKNRVSRSGCENSTAANIMKPRGNPTH